MAEVEAENKRVIKGNATKYDLPRIDEGLKNWEITMGLVESVVDIIRKIKYNLTQI